MAKRATKVKKPTDEFPPLHMIIEKGRLVPAFPLDFERLDSYRNGTKMLVWMATGGDRPLVRRWWATLGNYLKHTTLPWGDRETASAAIKLALAMVVPFKMPSGQWSQYPRSLNDLDDAELENKIREMEQLLFEITGIDVETLRREAAGDEGFAPEQTNPPDNDAGDETLAGATPTSTPTVPASEEGTGAEDSPDPAGTGASDIQEKNPSAEDVIPPDSSGVQSARANDTAAPDPAAADPAPEETAPPPADSSGADTLSADELLWLKQGAKMMLACQPKKDAESLRVLIVQLHSIKAIMPKDVGHGALKKMEAVRLHCMAVCKGEAELDCGLVAKIAMTSIEEITPEPVTLGRR